MGNVWGSPECTSVETTARRCVRVYWGTRRFRSSTFTVPMADTTGHFGVFMDVDLHLNDALRCSVDLNDSALHYPVDIYDRGD